MSRAPKPTHSLPATVTRVVDGDTVHVEAQILPFPSITVELEVRLNGINAQEHNLPGGPEATAHLAGLVGPLPAAATLNIIRPDKYGGRILGQLVTPADVDVAAQMVVDGYAAAWNGTGSKPVPPWPIPAPA
ncbi:thermonuclease family protein [Pseudonocardia sp. T1-2H]|uniref:thermonuclease family protein n=1 Tax=Pseudonocardia sp. T1-2H TaxID=3128899 RepID=UPI003101833C